jgi:hypothetical protein
VLRVLGRAHPSATDFWDGNWLRTRIDAVAGDFSGGVTADVRADELADLRAQLDRLYRDGEGDASFTTLEYWINLEFHRDGLGHVQVRGEMFDMAGRMGNSLRFRLDLDQTYLPPIIDALEAVERAWPILGNA